VEVLSLIPKGSEFDQLLSTTSNPTWSQSGTVQQTRS